MYLNYYNRRAWKCLTACDFPKARLAGKYSEHLESIEWKYLPPHACTTNKKRRIWVLFDFIRHTHTYSPFKLFLLFHPLSRHSRNGIHDFQWNSFQQQQQQQKSYFSLSYVIFRLHVCHVLRAAMCERFLCVPSYTLPLLVQNMFGSSSCIKWKSPQFQCCANVEPYASSNVDARSIDYNGEQQ